MGIEHSFLKPEALGSIPSTDTLKKERKKEKPWGLRGTQELKRARKPIIKD